MNKKEKKLRIGYTQGTFDLFHIGHLNIIARAKERCDYLIVGVNNDDLVESYKGKKPIICCNERMKIIAAVKQVDEVVKRNTLEKLDYVLSRDVGTVYVGSDWENSARWKSDKELLGQHGVKVEFLPYTRDISTTEIIGLIRALPPQIDEPYICSVCKGIRE